MKLDLSTILCSPPTCPLQTNIYTLLSRFSGCKLASRVFWFRELFLKCVYTSKVKTRLAVILILCEFIKSNTLVIISYLEILYTKEMGGQFGNK